jgi:hypothetical protein
MGAAGLQPGAKRRQVRTVDTCAGEANALGDERILRCKALALICSQKCPGDAILNTYDFARLVRGSGITIVSGFHSPIEKDCLPIHLDLHPHRL